MRQTKRHWLEEGLRVLAEDGRRALTIERLTAALGVTKGSFYHHFANARDFEEQVVGYWADTFVEPIESLPNDAPIPVAFLDRLVRDAYSPTTAPEVAIRAWAQLDEGIRPYVARVDAARRKFVRRVLAPEIGESAALDLATDTLIALLVGALALEPRLPADRVLVLYEAWKDRYLPASAPQPSPS